MKIAIIIWDLSISGGTQRQALELANYLVKKKYNVKLYCAYLNRQNCHPNLIKNLQIYSLYNLNYVPNHNFLRRFFYPLEPLFSKELNKKIVNLMDKDFEVVNCHEHRAYRIGYIYKQNCSTPIVWMMNDLPGTLKTPQIKHNIKSLFKFFLFPFRGGVIGKYLDKNCISEIDHIIVLDKRNKNLLKENTGVDATIIRSGLDVQNFKFQGRNFNSNKKEFKILATGIFFPNRRFEDLITALALLKKERYAVNLDVIGSDRYNKTYAKKVCDLVSRLKLTRYVNFLGAVSEEELIRSYSKSDIFVFPNYPQTWGLAVFEAMACGTPVVVSTGCGASEVLTNDENALLVLPKRPEEIAVCLRRLFNDEKLWKRLSFNGRKFVEENIRWDLYGENMLKLFNEVIEGGGN